MVSAAVENHDLDDEHVEPADVPVLAAANALLARRRHPKWSSLSWTTLRPLISSLNQVFIAASPRLISELRVHWAAANPGDDSLRVIDRSEADHFIVIGDIGEQDRSQYIVAPVLREVVRRDQPAFMVICSDVIYPSGDVNDYIHGLYLPYGPVPPESPEAGAAEQPLDNEPIASTDRGSARPTRTLDQLTCYALPGNHDWHDGLSGFMQHFCGVQQLDLGWLGWPGRSETSSSFLDQLGPAVLRMLLRRPAQFERAPLWRERSAHDSAPDTEFTTPMPLAWFSELRGGLPGQPGSYFAIQTSRVLIVGIDTGISGIGRGPTIDARQGHWLEQVSALPGPKILLTGSPLLVNAEWKECRIDPPLPGDPAPTAASVNEVIERPEHNYLAVIGGDVHNFQHYLIGSPTGDQVMHHIVSGGGGAYMAATHPVNVVRTLRSHEDVPSLVPPHDEVEIAAARVLRDAPRRRRGVDLPEAEPQPVVAPRPNTMIPSPAESLTHFGELLLPALWRMVRALGVVVLGLVAATVWIERGGSLDLARNLALVVTIVLVLRLGVPTAMIRERVALRAHRAVGVALWAGLGGCLAVAVQWLDPSRAERHLTAFMLYLICGAALAWQIRATGWWRPPSWPSERLRGSTVLSAMLTWMLCLALAFWAGQATAPGTLRAWVPPGIVIAVGLLGTLTYIAPRRQPTLAARWRSLAAPVAYGTQAVLLLTAMTTVEFREDPQRPWAFLIGLIGGALTLATAIAAAAVLLYLWCRSSGSQWERLWGIRGGSSQTLAAALLILIMMVELAVSSSEAAGQYLRPTTFVLGLGAGLVAVFGAVWWHRGRRLLGAGIFVATGAVAVTEILFSTVLDAQTLTMVYRVQLIGQLAVITAVTATLTIDQLRRGGTMVSAAPRTLAAVAVWGVALALLNAWLGWPARAALATAVVIVLGVVMIAVSQLAYLGALSLALDLPAHQDRSRRGPDQPLIAPHESATFLDWRADPDKPRASPAAQRRAEIVFPPTDNPQGPIQRKVSEIFDSDEPPFFKNFLQLRLRPDRIVVEIYLVEGTGSVREEAEPYGTVTIRIPAERPADPADLTNFPG